MSREWKPGDVATVLCSDGEWRMAWGDENLHGYVWRFAGGAYRIMSETHARPLVVIDPADREQVSRLAALLGGMDIYYGTPPMLAAALREFADPTPPKPAEPHGLGAVVVDAEGRRYVRCSPGDDRWHCPDDDTGGSDDFYRNIPAVRVLSEGVTE